MFVQYGVHCLVLCLFFLCVLDFIVICTFSFHRFKLCADPKGTGFVLLYYKNKTEDEKCLGGALQLTNQSKIVLVGKVSVRVGYIILYHTSV